MEIALGECNICLWVIDADRLGGRPWVDLHKSTTTATNYVEAIGSRMTTVGTLPIERIEFDSTTDRARRLFPVNRHGLSAGVAPDCQGSSLASRFWHTNTKCAVEYFVIPVLPSRSKPRLVVEPSRRNRPEDTKPNPLASTISNP